MYKVFYASEPVKATTLPRSPGLFLLPEPVPVFPLILSQESNRLLFGGKPIKALCLQQVVNVHSFEFAGE
jgi:hypothetical protein